MIFFVTSVNEIVSSSNTSAILVRGRSDDYSLVEVLVTDFHPTVFYSPPWSIVNDDNNIDDVIDDENDATKDFSWSELQIWADGFIAKIESFLSKKVLKWSFCKGRTMYHYNGFSLPFLEVALFSSADVKQLLKSDGFVITDRGVHLHEAHIPLHLQFMISTTISPFTFIEMKNYNKESNTFTCSWKDLCQDEGRRIRPRDQGVGVFPTDRYMLPSLQRMLTKLSLDTQSQQPVSGSVSGSGTMNPLVRPVDKKKIPSLLKCKTMFSSYQASLSLPSPFGQTFLEEYEPAIDLTDNRIIHKKPKRTKKITQTNTTPQNGPLKRIPKLDPFLIENVTNKKLAFSTKKKESGVGVMLTLRKFTQLKRAPLPSELAPLMLKKSSSSKKRYELSQISPPTPTVSGSQPTPQTQTQTQTPFPLLTMLGVEVLRKGTELYLIKTTLYHSATKLEARTFFSKDQFSKYYQKVDADLLFSFRMNESVAYLGFTADGRHNGGGHGGRHNGGGCRVIMLPVQAFLKNELPSLSCLTFESLYKQIFGVNICLTPDSVLLEWLYGCTYDDGKVYDGKVYDGKTTTTTTATTINCKLQKILDKLDEKIDLQHQMILPALRKNCEFTTLIGINLSEVIWRGSQIRVESMLGRLARQEDFLMLSPTPPMVRAQMGPSVIPLVLEPKSAFYEDPVIVLDFQSLYPSLMIANNICYSTCLGDGKQSSSYGVLDYSSVPGGDVGDGSFLSECHQTTMTGAVFVSKTIREGLLPKILSELISARQKVKAVDNYKQLALKLIANVTYGYTAASYSGRMPNVCIADAIVQGGRDALQMAMAFVEKEYPSTRIVYGDTDSIFVCCPSISRLKAQALGKEMAIRISELFPSPMMMKFEKVYHPSLLVAKKRYVGFSYNGNIEGSLDVKGLEIVRKDACPLLKIIMERSLLILFRSSDLSSLKAYVQRQFFKILAGASKDLSLFLLTKKGPRAVDGANGANGQKDAVIWNRERDRIPFLVYQSDSERSDDHRLMDRMIDPYRFILEKKRLDYDFYIKKRIIPPLSRIFILLGGVDVSKWLSELPPPRQSCWRAKGGGIDFFVERRSCFVCGARTTTTTNTTTTTTTTTTKHSPLCQGCQEDEQRTLFTKYSRTKDRESKALKLLAQCPSTAPYEMCYNLGCRKFWGMLDFITIGEPH